MDGQVLKQAFAFAGALGRFQGLIEYVRRNPDYYSHEQLLADYLSWIVRNELSSMH
jgi:3-deoxy-D-arabino-heptulosonate 7-phosphate (DAHP) synthase class II